ncbi:amidinotransferase [Amycolatopsis taiwanensis]|uniref:Amidinotransferase n=2 Tax=Amycolatopsis taiwanensis TaxID=342230 RepID=A0A9W6VDQ4_9PSEU|nr:amidinotransferase [Amycolatopsis taiwanensis]
MTIQVQTELPRDGMPASGVAGAARTPTTRRYLMCSPRYFAVDHAINPWMDPARPVDVQRAVEEWTRLRDTYRQLGHTVEEIEPVPGLPDMVFAANGATVIGGRVLGARFRAAQRVAEAEHYRQWFVEHGYRDVVMPAKVNEGEGDLIWTGDLLLAGTGFGDPLHVVGDDGAELEPLPDKPFRTDPTAHAEAQEALGVPVLSLRLVDPRYYHLDTALMVLSAATETSPAQIAYYPEAFSPGSRRALARLFPDAVLAEPEDAECLGLNGVSDGYNVVLPAEATGLAERLAARGYRPVPVEVSELRKSGGGPKCCTLELRG